MMCNYLKKNNTKLICVLMSACIGIMGLFSSNKLAKTEFSTFLRSTFSNDADNNNNAFNSGFLRLKAIQRDCGDLCNTSRSGVPGLYFDQIRSKFSCRKLFENAKMDEPHGLPHAPKWFPNFMHSHFTMQNRIKIRYEYYDQTYLEKNASTPVWTEKLINDWVDLGILGKLKGTYGYGETNALRDGLTHASNIKNGRVLVIGSENPWVEALCLGLGAREVMTLEYGKIKSFHPKVKTILPSDFRLQYLNDTIGVFDAIVTFSSVEHSGLGRYGDALNPWGDIIAIAKAWCVTKPDGSLTIGVMYNFEQEYLRFNADRWYGKIRYPFLTTNWQQIYRGKGLEAHDLLGYSQLNFAKEIPNYSETLFFSHIAIDQNTFTMVPLTNQLGTFLAKFCTKAIVDMTAKNITACIGENIPGHRRCLIATGRIFRVPMTNSVSYMTLQNMRCRQCSWFSKPRERQTSQSEVELPKATDVYKDEVTTTYDIYKECKRNSTKEYVSNKWISYCMYKVTFNVSNFSHYR